ncbi:Cupin [Paracoccus tibetensis]|uniref:Cupin n=1 Tax=Paracoccus tibetensis TaxID=336292 RepID=A0A1G5JXG8_9RHOB|nr:Cupin [Paracoccus tibetensis]
MPAVAEPLIVWIISGEAVVEERDLGGDWAACHVRTGDFFLTRSATPYEMRWRAIGDAPFQVMHLYLSVAVFERVASDMLGGDAPPALRDVAGARDAQLSHLLALIHQELTAEGQGSEIFIHSLARCLAVHLIRHYAAAELDQDQQTALPGFRLRQAISYLQTHLAEPFSLAEVAAVVGMSEFHFSRLFKKATGMSPSRYLIRQRIARAQVPPTGSGWTWTITRRLMLPRREARNSGEQRRDLRSR